MIARYVICAGLILIYILCCGYCSLNYVDLMRMPNMILETSAIVLQHQKVSCVDLECTHVIQCLLCVFLLVSLFLRFSPRTPKMFDCSTAHPCRNSIMRTSHVEHWDAGICMKNLTATDGQRPNLTHHTKTRLAVNRLTRSSCLLSSVSCVSDTKDLFDTWTKRARRTKDTIETGRFLGRKMSTIHSAQYSNLVMDRIIMDTWTVYSCI